MDIRHLTYYIEVARHKSFTRASEVLHLSQPTISKMVKNLEEELGVTLLDRSGKQIRLTDAGEIVFARAQQIVKSFQHLSSELTDVMHIRRGHIRIGIPPLTGAYFFPNVLAQFHELYPKVTIEMNEEGAKKVEESVLNGSLDLGVTIMPVDTDVFEHFTFAHEYLMLLLHPEHRLAARDEVELTELREEKFILLSEGFALHEQIPAACIRAGFSPDVLYKSSQWNFISEMVAAGLGVALLPETVCRALDPARIRTIRVTPQIPWEPAMIWRRDGYLSFASREWIRFARDYLEQSHR